MGLYDNYGVIKEMQLEYDSAFYFYQKGLQLKEKLKDTSGLPYSLTNLGGLMVLQKRFEEAKPYFSRALDIRKKLGDTIGICETYLFLSDIYLEREEVDLALENLNFVIEQASEKGFYEMLSNSFRKRALIFEKYGDIKRALQDERFSRQFKDTLAQQSMRDKIAELQIEFETNEKEKELLGERIKAERFQSWLWILGLLLIIVLLTTMSIQIKRTSEKRKLALKSSKDLEFERMRIARDLHDNLGAELTIVTSKLDTKIYKAEKEVEKEELEQIAKQTRNAAIVLRETVWSIKSEKLTINSLKNKIEEFYRRFEDSNIFRLNFLVSNEQEELSPLVALNQYRIAQEALSNILKYAHAKNVYIEISKNLLKIKDDGKGFNSETVKKGYGLNNMETRAKEMNASFNIHSSNQGTEIVIVL
jgi:signal transduction histidine kinase